MHFGEPQPYWEHSEEVRKEARREEVVGEGLSERELSEHSALTSEDQELSPLKRTARIPVFYIVVSIVFVLILIVGILGANVFHVW